MVAENYAAGGIAWLQEAVKKNDPAYYQKGEVLNPQRMMRALEVVLTTGKSILSFQKKQSTKRDFNIIKIGLELPREDLYNRINKRVDTMVESGLIAEVESLISYKSLNSLQTVGYRELFDYFEGKNSLEHSINLIKQNTRHYAKRQMTWFKKDTSIQWVDMGNPEQALSVIKKII